MTIEEYLSKLKIYEVQDRNMRLMTDLLNVWEDSVRATHLFLSDTEIKRIKEYVPDALSDVEHLIIAENKHGKPIAFMGTKNSRLEMLFITPDEQGAGLGRRLLERGVCDYGVREVTVNEQNPQAVEFYKKMGFKVYKRTDCDEEGNAYPLLYMKKINDAK